jgi:HK97 family phage prohead protease
MPDRSRRDRPVAGQLEQRALPVELDGRRLRGVIPYATESRDLGGWRERIDPAALRGAVLDDLTCTVEHAGVPLGRYPTTLALEDREDGLHWSCEPPRSRADVIEAVERGDLRAGSWRMRVARERWDGDVRHVLAIAELRDVTLTAAPAYPSAAVELRHAPEESTVPEPVAPPTPTPPPADQPTPPPAAAAPPLAPVEDRSALPGPGLPVETATASSGRARGLTDRFRAAGFPGETAVLPFDDVLESRALTVTGGPDPVARIREAGVALGADQRWAWTAFPRVGVDAGVTSVDVLRQTARSLATPANTVRAIDAVTAKPETGSTITVVAAALKQVASVQTGIPNVYLESSAVNSIIEADLRLSVNGGLDKLVLDVLATAGFQAPGTDNLIDSIRKAITTIQNAGYSPDTLILRPSDAEALDLLKATATAGESVYIFPPGQTAPSVWNLQRHVSKSAAAPVVCDASAVGRLYVAPVSLARFEENAGSTNSSTVRMETNALCNVERIGAAVRIAAS